MAYPTAFVLHPACALHDTGWGHPEHQGRLPALIRAIERDMPALLPVLLQLEAEPASDPDLLAVHSPEHVALVREAADEAARRQAKVHLDPDTVVSAASRDAALAAAGCAITAAQAVLAGDAATAFAACRPPGHHAGASRPMGFCLFNNVAVGARWARRSGVGRILIVDWDVHHGNGTQEIFYRDPDVYYLSLHLSPHYPGTGAASERGEGRGAGTTRNVPLSVDTGAAEYHAIFDDALDVTLAEFEPELVFVSAGFDCLAGDPLGGLRLEPHDLHRLTRRIRERTAPSAGGRVVAVLEGGYAPDRLGRGAVSVLHALAGLPPED